VTTISKASLLILAAVAITLRAAAAETNLPPPTFASVRYGPYPSNLLDFWQAKSDGPAPVVFFVHGGGWRGGNKSMVPPALVWFMLEHHISVSSIDYRLSDKAKLPAPVHDAARALQFIRSKAAEWVRTRIESRPSAALREAAPRFGWPTTMTWRTRPAPTRWRANPRGFVLPWGVGTDFD